MKSAVTAFIIGIIFGLGLLVSGMLNPAKVQGFLDITGLWDPSLAFVMVGGIGVSLIGLKLTGHMIKPVFADIFHHPVSRHIDARLCIGAILFGIGWGIGGLCPGPAIAVLGFAGMEGIIFVSAMLIGLFCGRQFFSSTSSKT